MKTILIVDDNPDVQETISSFIKSFTNYSVLAVEDGEEALDIVTVNKPDLILLDMMLPRIGGIALYKDLRKMEITKDTPVIFMSGQMKHNVFKKEGIEMGAVDYITKPFDFEYLLNKIKELLGDEDNK